MRTIEWIKDLDLGTLTDSETAQDKDVSQLYDGPFRKLVEIRLRNSATLSKHKANEPITVLCLSGKGVFRAGPELQDIQALQPGTLITLDASIEHEVAAQPKLHLLVTKFKNS